MRCSDGDRGVSCSDPVALLNDALRFNASAIFFSRGKEIRGKLPDLMQMQGAWSKTRKQK
jgi:hypothetical protein